VGLGEPHLLTLQGWCCVCPEQQDAQTSPSRLVSGCSPKSNLCRKDELEACSLLISDTVF